MGMKLYLALAVLGACCFSWADSWIYVTYRRNSNSWGQQRQYQYRYEYYTPGRKNYNSQITDSATFFQRANYLPFDLYNNYMCAMFNPLHAGYSRGKRYFTTSPSTWYSAITRKCSSDANVSQVNTTLQRLRKGMDHEMLMELRNDLLSDNGTNICDLVALISRLYTQAGREIMLSMVEKLKEFYVSSPTSSVYKLSDSDLKRLLVSMALAIKGIRGKMYISEFKSRIWNNLLDMSLPDRYTDEQRFLAKESINSLKTWGLSALRVKSLLRTFIAGYLSSAANNNSNQRQRRNYYFYRYVFRTRLFYFDHTAACYVLKSFSEGSPHCGIQYLAREIATVLSCPSNCTFDMTTTTTTTTTTATTTTLTSTIPASSSPSTSAPTFPTAPPPMIVTPRTTAPPPSTNEQPFQGRCGVSGAASRMAQVMSSPLMVTPRIVGGSVAGSCRTYPWMVHIGINDGQLCGGAILDETHILTSAHCAEAARSLQVTVGEYDTRTSEGTEQVFDVDPATGVFIHEDFDAVNMTNDIAVLKLNASIEFNRPCAEAVCLDPSRTITNGESCVVAGWGATVNFGVLPSRRLQSVSLPVFRGTDCDESFPTKPDDHVLNDKENQLCAGQPEAGQVDSCAGDSGSPLFCQDPATSRWTAVGIVSYGYRRTCGQAGTPGVYTRVASYSSWIQEQMEK